MASATGPGWVTGSMWPAPGTVRRPACGTAAAITARMARHHRRGRAAVDQQHRAGDPGEVGVADRDGGAEEVDLGGDDQGHARQHVGGLRRGHRREAAGGAPTFEEEGGGARPVVGGDGGVHRRLGGHLGGEGGVAGLSRSEYCTGSISVRLATRSGDSMARRSATVPPNEWPTRCAGAPARSARASATRLLLHPPDRIAAGAAVAGLVEGAHGQPVAEPAHQAGEGAGMGEAAVQQQRRRAVAGRAPGDGVAVDRGGGHQPRAASAASSSGRRSWPQKISSPTT